MSETFTRDRLQGIAQKLDIAHGGAFDVGLPWLAPPAVILDLAEEPGIIGRYKCTFTAFSGNSIPLAVQIRHHMFTAGKRGCGELHPTLEQNDGASTICHWCGGVGLDLPAVETHVQVSPGKRVWPRQAGAGGLGLPGALAQLVEAGGRSVRRQSSGPCHLPSAQRILHVSSLPAMLPFCTSTDKP